MCRITGFWDFNYHGRYDLTTVVTVMRDTMTHGGPDDAGIFIVPERGLALGHRRLSIIDLSKLGHQPMSSADKRFTITYNGEIYNYRDIKQELEEKGHRFTSNSDTEVILNAYREWGTGCLSRFRGMWAFALWDEHEQRLLLCRDRAGVKPLYWYFQDGLLLFSSELKALHQHPGFIKELDKTSLADFFKYGSIPAPHSIFKHVHKLAPGHFIFIDRRQCITDIQYWDAYDQYERGQSLQREGLWDGKTDNDIRDELEKILRDSFKLRMVADVPVGVFLSGGIDSSLVSALLTAEGFKLKTFTIGFDERKYNEAPHARNVARHLGADHTELICTPKQAQDVIPLLPGLYDEPFGDSSAIPTYLVSKLARQQVKVSVSADGGDELFCGYSWYSKLGWVFRRLNTPVIGAAIRTALPILGPGASERLYSLFNFALPHVESFKDDYFKLRDMASSGDFNDQYLKLLSQIDEGELARFGLGSGHDLRYRIDGLDYLSAMMLIDFKMYLTEDILVKVDRATMGVSLEGREPFLDHKLIEYAGALPMKYKMRNGVSKTILRDILHRYVPRSLVERPKQGFAIPVEDWLRSDLAPLFNQYVNPERIKREGIIDASVAGSWKDNFLSGRTKINTKLWYLFVFEMWAERWL